MKKRLYFLGICVLLLVSLCSCKITSNKKISDKKMESQKKEYEEYLAEKYPDEKFTVNVWQEYRNQTGGAGLPDYEGYVMRHVVIDSKGNRFRISTLNIGEYSDDYEDVLNGDKYYNEEGKRVYFDENGEVKYVSDY